MEKEAGDGPLKNSHP